MEPLQRRIRAAALVGTCWAAASIAGCKREPSKAPAFAPLPARVMTLSERVIADRDDYLASLTSRRSVTILPQISGYIRAIPVKPGDRVRTGALLVDIDPGQQDALLRSLIANIATRRANLAYAIQNDESSRGLVASGLLSELDYQQRHAQRVAAEADVKAGEEQVRAQTELLRFYRVTAPNDGVVGDVPVKIGDYVTPQTRLTSVDEDGRLEVYVYIPVDKVNSLTGDSSIAVLGENGRTLCEQKPTFVSPQVDVATQSVLVKTVCPNAGELRTAQVLTGRMIWARHAGLAVPVDAVSRLSGQYFVFRVDRGPQGAVARQTPVTVGSIVDNDYVIRSGLSPGAEVVVSNVQKIRDGAPLAVEPIGPPPPRAPAGGGPPP